MRETEGLIKQGFESTPDQAYGQLSQGVGDSKGLLTQDDNFNQGLSYGDQALTSAIRSKFSKPHNIQMSGMENKMKLDARNAHFAKIQTAHQLANEEANLNFQKELIKYKQKKQKQAQRSALIGQTLGLVGGVVGGIYGGPAGAAGGMAGGQMVGSQLGGGQDSGGLGG